MAFRFFLLARNTFLSTPFEQQSSRFDLARRSALAPLYALLYVYMHVALRVCGIDAHIYL